MGLQLKAPRIATRSDNTFVMNFSNPDDTRSNKSGQHKANTAFRVNCKKQYWKTVYENGQRTGYNLSNEQYSYDYPVFEVCGNPNLITGPHD